MRLHDIGPAPGATKKRKRVGRGPGSGHGEKSCRGENGQKSRSGYSRRWGFEGGQMPLVRRLPKRGFTNIFREECAEINVAALQGFEAGSVVDAAALVAKGLVRKKLSSRIKLLGHGEIDAALTVHVHAATAGARRKIEAAGGKIELIGAPADEQR